MSEENTQPTLEPTQPGPISTPPAENQTSDPNPAPIGPSTSPEPSLNKASELTTEAPVSPIESMPAPEPSGPMEASPSPKEAIPVKDNISARPSS